MPKQKTHSGASKRLHVTASGRVKHKRTNMRHLLRKRSTKAKRHLNADSLIDMRDMPNVRAMLQIGSVKRKKVSNRTVSATL